MTISLHDISAAHFVRLLTNLDAIMAKAEAYAAERKFSPDNYVGLRFAPDMHPFSFQIQSATDRAKFFLSRSTGQASPSWPDTEKTWAEVRQRLQTGLGYAKSFSREQIDGREDAPVKFKFRGDATRTIELREDEVVSLDSDEDIEQIQVRLDVFPTQVHGQQLLEVLSRATGLSDAVWGRITQAANSGRALAVADAGGLGALTIRSLAHELGVKPMSVYHYVANKDEIIDGIVDLVFSEIDVPSPGGDWRSEMQRRFQEALAQLPAAEKRHQSPNRNTPGYGEK